MEYYTVITRNEIGSFVKIWMDLDSVIQSEVRKEKSKYHILMHICVIHKNGIYDPVCKAELETQI